MYIPEELQNERLYHFTHIDNVEKIIHSQCILAKNKITSSARSIAYSDIQDRRATMEVPVGPKGVMHDYVPFYFCKKSPMLYAVVSNKIAEQSDLVYFEFPISLLDSEKAVFTSSSANSNIQPHFYSNVQELKQLDWDSIRTFKWGSQHDVFGDLPVRKKKMAEGLIWEHVDLASVLRITVWDRAKEDQILKWYENAKVAPPRIVSNYPYNKWYYYNSPGNVSAYMGPISLANEYFDTIDSLTEPTDGLSCDFESLNDLRDSLDDDFSCTDCTEGCIGLRSRNEMHASSVDEHTLEVVDVLREFKEFQDLDKDFQVVMELAAFFHDVGKGPRSRWGDGVQHVDPDHPIKSLRLLAPLLCNEVREWDVYEAQLLCMLVCYHDLVGMIMGAGRQLDELIEIVEDVEELDLLIMLSKADIYSVNAYWWNAEIAQQIRDDVITARGW